MITATFCSSRSLRSLSKSCFNFTTFNHIKAQARLVQNLSNPRRLCNAFPNYFQAAYENTPIVQSVICAISSCSSLPVCQTIHSLVIKSLSYTDEFVGDRLVSLYAKLGCFEDACNLFDEIPHKDLVSWNSFISFFSRKGDVGMCLNAFYRMRLEGGMKPNVVTLISIISACVAIDEGTYIHGFALKTDLISERKVANSLINMYGNFGYLDSARCLFEMILVPNLVSWNSIVKIHVQNGFVEESVCYFNSMRRTGISPDQATMVTLLQGCDDIGVGKLAEALHAYILIAGLNKNIPTLTALLSVYAKSGRLTASCEIFREMKNPDKVAWTAMLASYAVHGYVREAIKLFDLMVEKGHKPDHVTFTHLLSACSHSGLIKEGRMYFEIMSTVYALEPRLDHYSCMVDLLGRSGRLTDACLLIERMPMEPNYGVWGALLNACKVYGNIELGREVAERLFALNPSDPRNYIMLSSIYSKAGHWNDVSKVRAIMKERGLIRTPGWSSIEFGNKIHRFVVGDRLHPDSESIYTKLEEIIEKIQKVGYVPNTEFVLHDVDEEVKEDMINKHSEKLAIAFGLMVSGAGMPLIITKNLRICGDCHNMAKFVSVVEKRMIIIRDTRRFHHFSDGLCSCGDYW